MTMSHTATCEKVSHPGWTNSIIDSYFSDSRDGESNSYSSVLSRLHYKMADMNSNSKPNSVMGNSSYDLFAAPLPQKGTEISKSSGFKAVKGPEEKRQERAIKNRESAQASRERKRHYMEELERDRDALTLETKSLRARVGVLEEEKSTLMNEMAVIKQEMEQLKQLVMRQDLNSSTNEEAAKDNNAGRDFNCAPTTLNYNNSIQPSSHYHHHRQQSHYNDETTVNADELPLAPMSESSSRVADHGQPALQHWVWRGPHSSLSLGADRVRINASASQSAGSVATHLPSATINNSGHLLVLSSPVAPLMQDPMRAGQTRVMRLRLRYRRSPANCHWKTFLSYPIGVTTKSKGMMKKQMSGSAHGSTTLTRSRYLKQKRSMLRRRRHQMTLMLWDQIIGGHVERHLKKNFFRK